MFGELSIQLKHMQIINSEKNPPWWVKEEYRKINRSKEDILIVGIGPETSEVRFMYPDFVPYKYDGKDCLLYNKVIDNYPTFKIGSLELEYIREDVNSAWRNCRAVELGLGKWFSEKYENNIFEIGDVSCAYSYFKGWQILDPDGPYINCIRKDVMDHDYSKLNVLSISTFEHMNNKEYHNNDPDLGIKALKKVTSEASNYLITIPIGGWRPLEDFIKNQKDIKYTFMVRENRRGETNNWVSSNDENNFGLEYAHFEYMTSLYGSALAICVLSNQPEIIH